MSTPSTPSAPEPPSVPLSLEYQGFGYWVELGVWILAGFLIGFLAGLAFIAIGLV